MTTFVLSGGLLPTAVCLHCASQANFLTLPAFLSHFGTNVSQAQMIDTLLTLFVAEMDTLQDVLLARRLERGKSIRPRVKARGRTSEPGTDGSLLRRLGSFFQRKDSNTSAFTISRFRSGSKKDRAHATEVGAH